MCDSGGQITPAVIPDGQRGRRLPTELCRSGIYLSTCVAAKWVPALRAAACQGRQQLLGRDDSEYYARLTSSLAREAAEG
jgi:hypothetical protein